MTNNIEETMKDVLDNKDLTLEERMDALPPEVKSELVALRRVQKNMREKEKEEERLLKRVRKGKDRIALPMDQKVSFMYLTSEYYLYSTLITKAAKFPTTQVVNDALDHLQDGFKEQLQNEWSLILNQFIKVDSMMDYLNIHPEVMTMVGTIYSEYVTQYKETKTFKPDDRVTTDVKNFLETLVVARCADVNVFPTHSPALRVTEFLRDYGELLASVMGPKAEVLTPEQVASYTLLVNTAIFTTAVVRDKESFDTIINSIYRLEEELEVIEEIDVLSDTLTSTVLLNQLPPEERCDLIGFALIGLADLIPNMDTAK